VLTKQEIIPSSQDGVISKRVRLESSSGLTVDMRVVRPKIAPGEKLPVIVVMGGEGPGKDVVDLVGAPHGLTHIALD
jgi:hypothetical protein